MLIFILGTTAEALKMSPIWRRMRKQKMRFQVWSSGQHVEELDKGLASINEGQPDIRLANGFRGKNMNFRYQTLFWAPRVLYATTYNLIRARGSKPVVIVHGDTLTTLLGAVAARFAGAKVVHLEAGLRSGDLRNPFPEEIVRRIVSRVAHFHLCPTLNEVQNLRQELGESAFIANTFRNTAADNLIDFSVRKNTVVPQEKYIVVTIHRSETVDNQLLMKDVVTAINTLACKSKVVLVQDHRFKSSVARFELRLSNQVKILEKLAFPEFIQLVSDAEFVVTDSGGLQEELAILGIPTIIHRVTTERLDGLNRNIILSHGDVNEIIKFSLNYEDYRMPITEVNPSPSDVALRHLIEWNLINVEG